MRSLWVTMVVCYTLLASCGREEKSAQPSLMEASKQELADALAERDRLLQLVAQVSQSMQEVKDLEHVVTYAKNNSDSSATDKNGILSDISSMQSTLQQRRKRLSALEKDLEESNLYNDDLKSVVNSLRKQLDRQSKAVAKMKNQLQEAEKTIATLNKRVDSLSSEVVSANKEREKILTESRRVTDDLYTCYFVVANQQDLKKHDIIETSFLRKTKILEKDFDRAFFMVNDRRYLDSIDLHSSKCKLLTNHPAGSYEILDRNRNKILHIIDPDKFWSLTNYLVIQTD